MKKLLLINITLLIWSTNISAEMIYVGNDNINAIDTDNIFTADVLVGSSNQSGCSSVASPTQCDFQQTFTTNYFSDDALRTTGLVTSDYRTSVKSSESDAYLDLGFSNNVVNGAGNDLILFFIGNTTSFGLEVFDTSGQSMFTSSYIIDAPIIPDFGDAVRVPADPVDLLVLVDGWQLSAILIDLGEASEGAAIGNLHLTVENSNFSLAGGFHTQAAVVPLPLPVVLFSSGLALLGWLGCRRKV